MRHYLQRTQTKATPDDKGWSIISHLEGETRNYIINKEESEQDTLEKVFEILTSRFGNGGNQMQVRQAFATRLQLEKEDWLQYLTPWKDCAVEGSTMNRSLENVTKSSNVPLRVFVTLLSDESYPYSTRPKPP